MLDPFPPQAFAEDGPDPMLPAVTHPAGLRLQFEPDDDEAERTIEIPADRPFEMFSILETYRPRCRVSVWNGEQKLCTMRLTRAGLYEIVK